MHAAGARVATAATSGDGVPVPRRRGLARAGLWVSVVAACSGEPEVVAAPQGRVAQPAGGAMVPAATREVKLPTAHLAGPPEPTPALPKVETPPVAGGPREVPPGTPPAIAKVFQRLPVAIHDGPPVGGIGATGIHVDKIWLGTKYEKDGCAGEAAAFSLARDRQVNFCFRVVHTREEEMVEVEWVKDGALFRRHAVKVADTHAYRTRAYLVLRGEYVGTWQTRVLSADGVVLASAQFSVTP